MNIQQAKDRIKELFESPFDKEQFTQFVKNLLNHMEDAPLRYQGKYIPEKFRQYVKTLDRVGKYSDGEHTLDVLVITLQKQTSLERARTMQRNFIAWYLNGSRPGGGLKDAALVAYISPEHNDWRFSLVKMDYKFEKTASGKVKIKEEFTPARRWSFLVGTNEKSHTAQSRLLKILANDDHNPSLEELEDAFNIETVTKEFFLKYRDLFIRTKEALDEIVEGNSKVKADFEAKGVDTVNFAKKLLGQIIFLYFLQKKGWFGVGRDDDWGSGSRHFLRELFEGRQVGYDNFFNDILEPLFYEALRIDRRHDDDYYSRFNCKIPFLNGGLFDPIGNYDWVHVDIHLPNELFSNTQITKEGDTGDGILDVFDRYNFTVREDEPLEKEVAIDPELLGKAYEKFNAIRPDNFDEFTKAIKSGQKGQESKFNKKFGVYYTPREIVHYMCQQSLINYLHNCAEESKLDIPVAKQDIEDLIQVGELITEHEAIALVKEQNIKNGIQNSSDYASLLSDGIRKNAQKFDEWLADITVCDPAVGSGAFPVGMMNEIVRARNVLSVFLKEDDRSDYNFKSCCIEHSLYGVDIDPGAVEIAKLRLWLSLVVDEEDIKNIKPLPNLDYKVVCGNSLIGLPEDLSNRIGMIEIQSLIKQLFSETNPTKKNKLKNEIDSKISRFLSTTKKNLGYHVDFDFKIFFSEVFHEKNGFDVVIGNPPYKEEMLPHNFSSIYYTYKTKELYAYFFEKSVSILNDTGVISFITGSLYLKGLKYQPLRNFLMKNLYNVEIKKEGDKVFDNVKMPTSVLIGLKGSKKMWLFEDFIAGHKIIKKIEDRSIPLKSYTRIQRGLEIGKDKVFNYDFQKKGVEIITGSDISKWFVKRIRLIKDSTYNIYKKDSLYHSGKRILIRETGNEILCLLLNRKIINNRSIYSIKIVDNKISYETLIAILNSKLIQYYYSFKFKTDTDIFPKIRIAQVRQIPIKDPPEFYSYTSSFSFYVNTIIAITKDEDYLQNPQKQARVKEFECKIDQLVYQAYGLTDEEIRIVEDET